MIVFSILFCLILFSFFIPKRIINAYFLLSAVVLAVIYFFYIPPYEDDLYRHYELWEIARTMTLQDILYNQIQTNNSLYNNYLLSSKVYLIYLYFIAKLPIREFLPVITTLIIYILSFYRIKKIGKTINASKLALIFGFVSFLCIADFRDFSCIRNMLAYALFTYTIYEDLVNNKNKFMCFIIYILLCQFHMACTVLLVLRFAVLFSNKYIKRIIVITLLGIYTAIPYILESIQQIFNIPYLMILITKITDYRIGRTEYNWNGAFVYICIIMSLFLLYKYVISQKTISENFKKYNLYSLYVITFTIGSFSQYDILRRSTTLMIMTVLPYIVVLFNHITIEVKQHKDKYQYQSLFLFYSTILFFSLLFFSWISYIPMDNNLSL